MPDANTLVAIDSLVANEYEVELDGEKLLGVFRVEDFVSFKIIPDGGETSMKPLQPPFKLAKMVQRDGNAPFNKWLRETIATGSGHLRPRRTLALVAVDDGVETRRWTIKGAWISEARYSTFDSASSEMVEETITIHYDSIEEVWSATPDLE
jgi:hypothetical protein